MRGTKIAIARSRLGFRSTSASRSKRNACWLSQPSGSAEAATDSAMPDVSEQVRAGLLRRNAVSRRVFGQEAVNLSLAYPHWIPAIVQSDDILTVFGPPTDGELMRVVQLARSRGVLTIDLWGGIGDVAIGNVDDDPF